MREREREREEGGLAVWGGFARGQCPRRVADYLSEAKGCSGGHNMGPPHYRKSPNLNVTFT